MEIVTLPDGTKAILELDEDEISWWRQRIGYVRAQYVEGPKTLVENHFIEISRSPTYQDSLRQTSTFIRNVREATWAKYIQEELEFYKVVITTLLEERNAPREVLESLLINGALPNVNNAEDFMQRLTSTSDLIGVFSGRIFPYFYELAKSVTQSRRSRAGTEFETTIAKIMEGYGYSYSSQSQLGQRIFETGGLGKKVDGIVPSMEAFTVNRRKCIITTMKTTIRERWQEVVEEINRTNIPSIFLLTLDEGITENVLTLMNNHNMTLVTYKDIKDRHPTFNNIISFEQLFNEEIPTTLEWWDRNHPNALVQT